MWKMRECYAFDGLALWQESVSDRGCNISESCKQADERKTDLRRLTARDRLMSLLCKWWCHQLEFKGQYLCYMRVNCWQPSVQNKKASLLLSAFFLLLVLWLMAFVRCCVLLDGESLIHVEFIPLFVIHAWHPRFPFNGIKTHLTWYWKKNFGQNNYSSWLPSVYFLPLRSSPAK